MRVSKFKKGQKARVKSLEKLKRDAEEIKSSGAFRMKDRMHIVDRMFSLCGQVVTIKTIVAPEDPQGYYLIDEDTAGYSWSDSLLEDLAPLKEIYG